MDPEQQYKYRENKQLLIGHNVGAWIIKSVSGQKVTLERDGKIQTMSLGRLLSGDYLVREE